MFDVALPSAVGVELPCSLLPKGNTGAPVSAGFGANGDGARPWPNAVCVAFVVSAPGSTDCGTELGPAGLNRPDGAWAGLSAPAVDSTLGVEVVGANFGASA